MTDDSINPIAQPPTVVADLDVRNPGLNMLPSAISEPGTYDLADPEVQAAFKDYLDRELNMLGLIGRVNDGSQCVRITRALMDAGTRLTQLGVILKYQGNNVVGARATPTYPPSGRVNLAPMWTAEPIQRITTDEQE